ncbi:MAG: cell division protein ZapA [Prevotella sp.]|nr:cell division protein ZapA [Prevotella sp.]
MAEANERKRKITLHLYDTDLSVNVPVTEEEYYRKGEKLITNIVNRYATHFKDVKTEKEILYMAMIDIALRYEKEYARRDATPLNDILSRLTTEIEEALQ